eukprot:355635-Chlamydomonas_euryale.AAC.4
MHAFASPGLTAGGATAGAFACMHTRFLSPQHGGPQRQVACMHMTVSKALRGCRSSSRMRLAGAACVRSRTHGCGCTATSTI